MLFAFLQRREQIAAIEWANHILELIIIYNSFIRRLFSLKFHSCFVIHFMKLLEYIHGFTFVNTATALQLVISFQLFVHYRLLSIISKTLLFSSCYCLVFNAHSKGTRQSSKVNAAQGKLTTLDKRRFSIYEKQSLKIEVCVIDC